MCQCGMKYSRHGGQWLPLCAFQRCLSCKLMPGCWNRLLNTCKNGAYICEYFLWFVRSNRSWDMPWCQSTLRSWTDGQCECWVSVSITVAVVQVPATIPTCPDKYASFALAALLNSFQKSSRCQWPRSLHSLAIIIWTPAKSSMLDYKCVGQYYK